MTTHLAPVRRDLRPCLLVVEGKDDEAFCRALLCKEGLEQVVTVVGAGGRTEMPCVLGANLMMYAPALPAAVGVLRDADDDAQSAFRSGCSALQRCNLPIPLRPGSWSDGTVHASVYVLPDNQRDGMLEDLCTESVEGTHLMQCVDDFLRSVGKTVPGTPVRRSKARAYAYLAATDRPDIRIGEAASAGIWPADSKAFADLRRWLSRLAGYARG